MKGPVIPEGGKMGEVGREKANGWEVEEEEDEGGGGGGGEGKKRRGEEG